MSTHPSMTHPSDEDFAAYLARTLRSDARAVLEAHAAHCPRCRTLLAHAGPVVAALPPERPARWRRPALAVGAGLVAAGLVAVVLLRAPASMHRARDAGYRDAQTPHQALQVVIPPTGTQVDRHALRFTWRPPASATLYEITLSAADGQLLWSARLEDTTVTPPAEVTSRLEVGRRYFWRVDALLGDLRSVGSGEQALEIRGP